MSEDTEPFVPKDRLLLVSIRDTIKRLSVYDATRYAWPVNRERAENADLVLGCVEGVVKGVFVASKWLDASPGEATGRNFPGLAATHKGRRWGFGGGPAYEASQRSYLGKRVPNNLAIGQIGFRYSYDLTVRKVNGKANPAQMTVRGPKNRTPGHVQPGALTCPVT
jgi:hypothetical protein